MKRLLASLVLALTLAGCGKEGPAALTPDLVQGTWGADCSKPFIKIAARQIHVYPDDADYKLNSASFDGINLVLAYDSSVGTVTETYVLAAVTLKGAAGPSANTLRLDHGHYSGMDAIWHKEPMQKC